MTAIKLDALVHYICAKCDDPSRLGITKLNKVLWHSDVSAYCQLGQSITGAVYIKKQFGPVPKDIAAARSRLKDDGLIIERQAFYHSHQQIQFVALKRPDISMFTSDEISIVDGVMQAICLEHAATSISEASHDLVWEAAAIGEEIPMAAAAFGGNIGELDADDVAWAQREIETIEKESAHA